METNQLEQRKTYDLRNCQDRRSAISDFVGLSKYAKQFMQLGMKGFDVSMNLAGEMADQLAGFGQNDQGSACCCYVKDWSYMNEVRGCKCRCKREKNSCC